MSNATDHQTEQDAITAQCEAGTCDHPECTLSPCERALEVMNETAALINEGPDYPNCRRAARILLAIAPAYDDDDTKTGFQDALSDLMHLCDLAEWDFSEMMYDARRNYANEAHDLGTATDEALRAAIKRN
jgi:hypothetical protein